MNKKKGLNFSYMDTKKHYKMYKSGKKWCYAAIATMSVALGVLTTNGATAQADTTDHAAQQVATTTDTNNVDSANSNAETTATTDNQQNNVASSSTTEQAST